MKLGIEKKLTLNFVLSLFFVLSIGYLFLLVSSNEAKMNLRIYDSHRALNIFESTITNQYQALNLFNDFTITRDAEKIKAIDILKEQQLGNINRLRAILANDTNYVKSIALLKVKVINLFKYYDRIYNLNDKSTLKLSGVLKTIADAKNNTAAIRLLVQEMINTENSEVEIVTSKIKNLYLTAEVIISVGVLSAIIFLIFFYGSTKKEILNRLKSENGLKIFGKAFKSVKESLIITDENNKVLFFNEAFKQKYHFTDEELTGKDISLIYSKRNSDRLLEKIFSYAYQQGWSGELYHITKEQEEFIVQISVNAVKDDNGKAIASVSVINDITERKRTEEEVQRYIEELQINKDLLEQNAEELIELNIKLYESEGQLKELNENKDKFFSIISHDLRSPFNSLLGLSGILANDIESLSNEEIKYFSKHIYDTSKNVLNLVDNLLQWSRLQTGKIEFSPGVISLRNLVGMVTDILKGNIIKKNIELRNEIRENTFIYADENMMTSVLQNLISNALKFTRKKGSIEIFDTDAGDFSEISVRDNGVGMTKENADKLFKIGKNSTTLGTADEKGNGLGLILCKEMVEKNNGKIWVTSEQGKGTTFTFTVPKDKILQNHL